MSGGSSYDVIVIGTGGVGSSAILHAARSGLSVLGLDRFPPGHGRGSSHGETRMIRLSYFEHPDYVPLLRHAYRLWDELVNQSGQDLFHRCGLLYMGPPEGGLINGVLSSAAEHGIAIETVNPDQTLSRFPGFEAGEGNVALFEENAGYLRVEDCVVASLREAVKNGAVHRHGETVFGWERDGEGVVVKTDQGEYRASGLIVTAGCWASDLLHDLGLSLRIVRKYLHWFEAPEEIYGEERGCPGFAFDVGGGCFYGFPVHSGDGLKVAEHTGGVTVDDPLEGLPGPEASDDERIRVFLSAHLPAVGGKRLRHAVCHYTMSPDEHYIVDRHPGHNNVVFAAGLSGHGFKCASALGDILVRMLNGRELEVPIDFLGLKRFEKSPQAG